MATPAIRPFRLTAADSRPLAGEVRTAGGARPTVVIGHHLPVLAERLARAGFTVVSWDATAPEADALGDLGVLLDALGSGALGVAASGYGLLGQDAPGAVALVRAAADERVRALVTWAVPATALPPGATVRAPWLTLDGAADEGAVQATIDWFARHLA